MPGKRVGMAMAMAAAGGPVRWRSEVTQPSDVEGTAADRQINRTRWGGHLAYLMSAARTPAVEDSIPNTSNGACLEGERPCRIRDSKKEDD